MRQRSEQVRAERTLRLDLAVTVVGPATAPGEATRVMFTDATPNWRGAVGIWTQTAAGTGEAP
ncbi:hypothetical protein ACP6C3_30370 [Mycolicibacterium septicum]|jgi:hypothetical protein|uniref:Uncharacterized protein n=5 Tax=Mycolicibacterium TaxID=1866885 RepID=A0A0J8WLU6_9MYCO|nr:MULTISPECIES: hypothetical protein [Mycolicibacterium]OCB42881.1 hypothetical protein A5721_26235 [Mycolicibacterium vulneris]KLI04299.1 hypothetical protein AA982_30720 [Mycolicibacterium senegalense]KLO50417.1 hypothetical protein ABW05_01710 [Mycolicibacterium senegalense]KMV13984.1 hypothetical protein ACT17_32520 [Mycolicibacterium conceptionense]MCV7200647.1 hypothetical protein [Mycolicibacterium peregrinum]